MDAIQAMYEVVSNLEQSMAVRLMMMIWKKKIQ